MLNTAPQLTSSPAPGSQSPASETQLSPKTPINADTKLTWLVGNRLVGDGISPWSSVNDGPSSSGRWPSWESVRSQSPSSMEWKPRNKPAQGSGFLRIKPAIVGAGLKNLGNTCFMNAILQCFTHTSLLVRELHSSKSRKISSANCLRRGRFCVHCALREHIEAALSFPGMLFAPHTFAENLNHISSNFERGQQEDAHEFLQCLLGRLEESCLGSKFIDKCPIQDNNLVQQIFGGSLTSRLRCCNCGHFSDTSERLIDLSLEIYNADTLESALDSFTKVESIEDQVFTCDNCKQKASVDKQLMLEKPPSVAVIHLKRFKTDGYHVEKINKHVDFPLELDLQPYCVGHHDNNADLRYDLYAVVVHEGVSSNLGHYYSYIQSSPNVWYKLDDWEVTRVHEDTVLLENGYMLFYSRRGTPWISDLIDVGKCFDAKNLNTSANSVSCNTDVACTSYGSPLNCNGCEAEHGELEADQSRPSEESNFTQNGANVDGCSSCTINDKLLQSGLNSHCSKNNDNEQKVLTSNKENDCDLEVEDRNRIVYPGTPSIYPNADRHDLDCPPVTNKTSRYSLKSEERMKRKRPQNIVSDSPEVRAAMRSVKKHMPMSKASRYVAALLENENERKSKKGKRTACVK